MSPTTHETKFNVSIIINSSTLWSQIVGDRSEMNVIRTTPSKCTDKFMTYGILLLAVQQHRRRNT